MNLAINGGKKLMQGYFPAQPSVGQSEYNALKKVFERKILSGYRGNFIPQFWGGVEVQALEQQFSDMFDVKYSLAVNSCTSALHIACGAIGLQPGDEVIVTPWSMSCSATAPLLYGAIPVFADIEEDTFCLDPKSVETCITDRTKAIIVVDLFGGIFNQEIMKIAEKHGLYVIEDAAQAIGAYFYKEKEEEYWSASDMPVKLKRTIHDNRQYAGTFGHIGCFSFTQGKHLTAGEGGMIVTDNEELMMKCAMIRNHAEAVCSSMSPRYQSLYNNLLGLNLRMTELQAAILQHQLERLNGFINKRERNVRELYKLLTKFDFIEKPKIKAGTEKRQSHAYYVQPFIYNRDVAPRGLHRDRYIDAVKAELGVEEGRIDRGVPLGNGYIQPLYRMPIFQEKTHWAFRNARTKNNPTPDYSDYENSCPVVEKLWEDRVFVSLLHGLRLHDIHIDIITQAFQKVCDNIEELV